MAQRLATTHAAIAIALALVVTGCGSPQGGKAGDPTTAPAADPAAPFPPPAATRPAPPADPKLALAYLDRVLRDDDRRVVVYKGDDAGELDDAGRRSLRAALPRWWQSARAEVPDPKRPWRITEDMGVTVYARPAKAPRGAPAPMEGMEVVRIRVFRARQVTRVTVTDPKQPKLGGVVFVLNSPEPANWVTRLFAGQL